MSKANLVKDIVEVLSGKDGIIIRKHNVGLEAGRVLNTDDYTLEVIPCGIPVAKKTENEVNTYKPIAPTAGGITLPEGYTYIGVAAATVRAGQACPIMISGVVNETAMLNSLNELFATNVDTSALSALKTACPHLVFMSDEVA